MTSPTEETPAHRVPVLSQLALREFLTFAAGLAFTGMNHARIVKLLSGDPFNGIN